MMTITLSILLTFVVLVTGPPFLAVMEENWVSFHDWLTHCQLATFLRRYEWPTWAVKAKQVTETTVLWFWNNGKLSVETAWNDYFQKPNTRPRRPALKPPRSTSNRVSFPTHSDGTVKSKLYFFHQDAATSNRSPDMVQEVDSRTPKRSKTTFTFGKAAASSSAPAFEFASTIKDSNSDETPAKALFQRRDTPHYNKKRKTPMNMTAKHRLFSSAPTAIPRELPRAPFGKLTNDYNLSVPRDISFSSSFSSKKSNLFKGVTDTRNVTSSHDVHHQVKKAPVTLSKDTSWLQAGRTVVPGPSFLDNKTTMSRTGTDKGSPPSHDLTSNLAALNDPHGDEVDTNKDPHHSPSRAMPPPTTHFSHV